MENFKIEIPEVVQKVIIKSSEKIIEKANTYDDEKRKIQKKFRLTERENYLLKHKMNQAGIHNFSLYARHMVLSGMTIHTDFSDLRNLIKELGKIGNNINQLAHKANSTDSVSKEDFSALKKEYDQLFKLVDEAILYKLKRARELQRTV
ncbi:bacterial mobilization protein MobC [Enterococcus faecalis 599]|uniref:plasmid mobilization protein n=1 Tax=Enterococcus faecalis TaxID=1351 RepID=UPI00027C85B9|nr:plasmid mobilization relaxosome protein MobC [Enterococcus faecalis]EJU88804.1 bacterial mobilization protein MobC [Enterococcus faecalis 599]WGH71233.1 plasmid mobilization relaxosome protein MobC [Enterococcus faecalis OG1RF]